MCFVKRFLFVSSMYAAAGLAMLAVLIIWAEF